MQKNSHETHNFLSAKWNAPDNVKTLITTRVFKDTPLNKALNGNFNHEDNKNNKNDSSQESSNLGNVTNIANIIEPFGNFNLALHVNDNPQNVINNRNYLSQFLPNNPYWLEQTHSTDIINLDSIDNENNEYTKQNSRDEKINGDNLLFYDASYTTKPNLVCCVMTADCLPILLTDIYGTIVASIHAGWRGLANGIIFKMINQINNIERRNILVHIAPCICNKHFIVGDDVLNEFVRIDAKNDIFFMEQNHEHKKYSCDLIGIAKQQLLNLGVLPQNISQSKECTYCDNHLLYSYRHSNKTGRFASLIWLTR